MGKMLSGMFGGGPKVDKSLDAKMIEERDKADAERRKIEKDREEETALERSGARGARALRSNGQLGFPGGVTPNSLKDKLGGGI